jgi:hypothetical protein
MAPEQFKGRADGRTDVWGLGVTLYELLTLRRAFQNPREINSDDLPRPCDLVQDLPRDLEAICFKAIRKEPARRYQSARELARDLRRWLASEPVTARKTHTARRVMLWAKRNKGWATAFAAGLAALVVTAAGESSWRARGSARRRIAPRPSIGNLRSRGARL